MRSFISEDDIEQAILKRLQTKELNYDVLICDSDPALKEDLNDGNKQQKKKKCVLPEILKSSLYRLNPNIDKKYIDEQLCELCSDFTGKDIVATNYKFYNQIRKVIKIKILKKNKYKLEFIIKIVLEIQKNNTITEI